MALDGKGVLILGPSGSGKSSLALQLIGLGAQLVSDDRTRLTAAHRQLTAEPPAAIAGLIEARGVGLLRVAHVTQARLALVVDMSEEEHGRLPAARTTSLLDMVLPCLHKVNAPYFPVAVRLVLTGL